MSNTPDAPGLGLDEPPQPASSQPSYRVLARKYRPQHFGELIGQEAMVKTLANAIGSGRLAHAFLLTGVRGVGKTSTARLIAKALNCVGPDGNGGPTIDPCGVCEPCVAIAQGRHIDVIEMDAASHTGVDDVREIIDAVRYASVSARYKIYIIDEVHQLSKHAFNALLKTLEEPPPHVKFLFATTEADKMPLTVLSRCQRFDLRRIPAERLVEHFEMVAKSEQVEVDSEALTLVARAAEGSVRDGLSILDQAISHGEGKVSAQQVREMLGLSDRGAVRQLLDWLLEGDAEGALAALAEQYSLGVEPAAVIRGLLEAVHGITRTKVDGAPDPALSPNERAVYADWAGRLSHANIHRFWQLLLKGLGDVRDAPIPLEAAEMALLRIIHAGELPDPGALVRTIAGGEGHGAESIPATPAPSRPEAKMPKPPASFADLVTALDQAGKSHLAQQLHDFVGLVSYAPPELALKPLKPLAREFAKELSGALKAATGSAWKVRIAGADEQAEPSLHECDREAAERERQQVLEAPVIKAAFEAFPDTELAGYTLDEKRNG
ncbi:MAG: DNA polymerase III subunit gamma/tau [Sphingosinicella sp.]